MQELIGKTFEKIEGGKGDYEITFTTVDGEKWSMNHHQDCCETVFVEDIEGDINDLIGSPLTLAEEVVSGDNPPGAKVSEYQDSFTWTFYKLGTVKGTVTIRWYGESNGFYSESVYMEKVH